MRRGLGLLSIALLGACTGEPSGQLVVDLKTDYVPGVEFAFVNVRATSGARDVRPTPAPAPLNADFVTSRRVAEIGDLEPGIYDVSIELRDIADHVVARGARRIDYGSAAVVTVVLGRSCDPDIVSCPPTGNAAATECSNGVCVEPCAVGEVCVGSCTDASTCPQPVASCAVAECTPEGECLLVPLGSCAAGEYCDPAIGCLWIGGDPDAGTSDGGTPDAGVDPCDTPEICNGLDDDCNGVVDDGACGPHETCGGAECVCEEGWLDCTAAAGCETPENASNCGDCGNACTGATPICEPLTDTCVNGCGAGLTVCGTACVRLSNDPAHCGACDAACSTNHASPACVASECRLSCDPGFDDCDRDVASGCEQRLDTPVHCGACGAACTRANAAASCATGSCVLGACDAGFGNCDGNATNGCEQALNTVTHCAGCGTLCQLPNATESCATGSCALGTCDTGFGNCDRSTANGCETDLRTLTNCGGCGTPCARANAAESCATGSCVLGACDGGFGNCDGNANNGCEQALNTTSHCGGCGVPCTFANASASCSTGTCVLGACNAGFGNCNGIASDGCETRLDTTTNCGGCGADCQQFESCTASLECACGSEASGPGGSGVSVCTGTLAHAASERCQGSAPRHCIPTSCDPGWIDCDGSGFNGCEAMACP
ncbi:MAG: hypothetical protein H6719_27960 [Sandaracinaceae bacterium]|nr:hypothetical protein [Sandaracinaceae bacterium]